MSQDNLIKLTCQDCKSINYWVNKNKKTVQRKLEFKKYCSRCQVHTLHKETK